MPCLPHTVRIASATQHFSTPSHVCSPALLSSLTRVQWGDTPLHLAGRWSRTATAALLLAVCPEAALAANNGGRAINLSRCDGLAPAIVAAVSSRAIAALSSKRRILALHAFLRVRALAASRRSAAAAALAAAAAPSAGTSLPAVAPPY